MKKILCSGYFSSLITKELQLNPDKDVTTIKVDLKLSTLKPITGKVMTEIYEHFKHDEREIILTAEGLLE